MVTKAIKVIDKTVITLAEIKKISIVAEECTGDGEFDTQNTWELRILTKNNESHTVFEARDYDNPNKWFWFHDAVKGKNYRIVKHKHDRLDQLLEEEKSEMEIITL